MGIAMVSIMLFHQPFFYGNPIVDFFHLYGHWGVEVFLFVSGFGLVHSLRKNSISRFYKNRCKRLLPACLFVGIFKYALSQIGFKYHTHDNIFLLATNLYLWYIYAIIVYYILAPWIYKLINYGIWILINSCIISYGSNFLSFGESPFYLINHIGWITARLPIFILGMYLTVYPLKVSNRAIVLIGLAFLMLCMGLQLASIMVRFQWKVPYLNLLLLPTVPMLCIFFHNLNKAADRIKISFIINYMGKHSLEFYLWHEYIYWNVYHHHIFNHFNASMKCILAICIITFLVPISSFFIKRIKELQLYPI